MGLDKLISFTLYTIMSTKYGHRSQLLLVTIRSFLLAYTLMTVMTLNEWTTVALLEYTAQYFSYVIYLH